MGSLKWIAGASLAGIVMLGSSATADAQNTTALAPYTFEIAPTIGKNLPYDIWGTPGTLSYYGVRSLYSLQAAGLSGAISASFLYQHAGPDHVYTTDFGWEYDFAQQGLNAFFNLGFHYSIFKLQTDYASDGVTCVPASCETDSGAHSGLFFGGGLIIPMSPRLPVRFGMRFYNGPELQLFLDMAAGIRF